jgi:glycogen debranching enzyme
LPRPVFEREPGYVELYDKAWELAWDHVVECEGAPQSPYVDEGFARDTLWIWDTCLMAQFCRYAPHVFPGIESLENFYAPLHDGVATPLLIQHVDNPPLFAWTEYQYSLLVADRSRLQWLLDDTRYLQKHFEWVLRSSAGSHHPAGLCSVCAEKRDTGYLWSGNSSGMDNTPRGRSRAGITNLGELDREYQNIQWFDLLAQQALSADCISKLGRLLGRDSLVSQYEGQREEVRALLDRFYWNAADGIYYDCLASDPSQQVRVKTPAAYWPMLAGVCNAEQAAALARNAADPEVFGGVIPWPSVDPRDPDFVREGMYWRGGVWLPTAYVATKALERYGYHELADELSERLLRHMLETYRSYEPHTIWECYSPTEPKPSTGKDNEYIVRPDFCGWSALGPISMFIENVLGFTVDAWQRRVEFRLHQPGRHGLENLRFADVVTSIVADGRGSLEVQSSGPYTLVVLGEELSVKPGRQSFANLTIAEERRGA